LIWVRDSGLIPSGVCVHDFVTGLGVREALLLLILFI
jgi:hypothetical protein